MNTTQIYYLSKEGMKKEDMGGEFGKTNWALGISGAVFRPVPPSRNWLFLEIAV